MTKTVRQNLILVSLAAVFFFVAKLGVDMLIAEGVESIGLLFLMLGGIPFLIAMVALLVRLWDMD
jgi:hypothetical protein